MKEIVCYRCKEVFAVSPQLYAVLMRSEQSFYCPHGHSQHFKLGPTEEDKLRRERDRLAQRIAQKDDEIARQRSWREAAERTASAYKGQATRLRKRSKAGVCPCCNRTFKQLAAHMANQHPGFAPEAEAPHEGATIQ